MKTKAAILWDVGTPWSVEEVEQDDPVFGEVRVKLAASGLCHSDDHGVKGDLPLALPVIGGHEGAGTIVDVGPGVSRFNVGDHVVLTFMPACGHCRWCAAGQQNLCNNGSHIRVGLPIADGKARVRARGKDLSQFVMLGTFSPYVVCHQDSCVKIDDDLSLKAAALVGCGVATGFGSAVFRAEVEPGDTVVVVGTGGVGSSAVQGSRIAGAVNIVAVDPFKYRREQTMLLGATHAVASMEEAIPLVSEITRGVMADKTILTVSLVTGDMVKPLLELTRKGGRAVITAVAAPTVRSVDIALTEFILSQKELVGSCFGGANGPEDVPNLMRLYRRGVLKRRCPQVC